MQKELSADEIRLLRKWNVIVAFPGSGKTTLVKQANAGVEPSKRKFVDFDIRGPRSPLSVEILNGNGEAVKGYLDAGCTVFSFMNYFNWDVLPQQQHVAVVMPEPESHDAFVEMLTERGDDESFITEYSENFTKWIRDWLSAVDKIQARQNVEVFYLAPGEYIIDVLHADDMPVAVEE